MSWHGAGSRAIDMADKGIRWGNMTPVYFFRNLGVDGLSKQNEALFNAEHESACSCRKARTLSVSRRICTTMTRGTMTQPWTF